MTEVLKHLRALENENSNLKEKLEITLYEKIELLTKLKNAESRLATYEIENLKYNEAIAELKEKYKKLTKDHDHAIQACCDADKAIAKLKKQLRKQKRKRCVAMARACHFMMAMRLFPNKEYIRKWVERGNQWIDLADKFKG